MIYLAEKKDVSEIVQIHKQEIKEGFLSSLPAVFLEKIYLTIVESDISFCIVAKEKNEVIGFISGTVNINKLYHYFIKRYFFYSIFMLLPKIFNIKKIFETLFYPKKEKDLPKTELLTIAVKKEFQGKGLGAKMFENFVFEMKNRGIKEFKVMVGEDLKPAIRFYEKNGFSFLKNVIVHDNKISKVYIYKIKD